jgi:uncharacterized protein (TIGR03067 family)
MQRGLWNRQFASLHRFLTTYAASRLTLKAMRVFRHVLTNVCLIAFLIANAGEQLTAQAKGPANQPTAPDLELQGLQGTWEGVVVGDKSDDKYTVTITGNSLHFYRDSKFWFATTITLPAGTDPRQFHATIKDSAPGQEDSVGKVVLAIYKIEAGKLTLAAIGDGDEETPKSFEAAEDKGLARYELRKVQPQRKIPDHPKPNEPKTSHEQG